MVHAIDHDFGFVLVDVRIGRNAKGPNIISFESLSNGPLFTDDTGVKQAQAIDEGDVFAVGMEDAEAGALVGVGEAGFQVALQDLVGVAGVGQEIEGPGIGGDVGMMAALGLDDIEPAQIVAHEIGVGLRAEVQADQGAGFIGGQNRAGDKQGQRTNQGNNTERAEHFFLRRAAIRLSANGTHHFTGLIILQERGSRLK